MIPRKEVRAPRMRYRTGTKLGRPPDAFGRYTDISRVGGSQPVRLLPTLPRGGQVGVWGVGGGTCGRSFLSSVLCRARCVCPSRARGGVLVVLVGLTGACCASSGEFLE